MRIWKRESDGSLSVIRTGSGLIYGNIIPIANRRTRTVHEHERVRIQTESSENMINWILKRLLGMAKWKTTAIRNRNGATKTRTKTSQGILSLVVVAIFFIVCRNRRWD